jgi:hypothetical protein
MFDRCLKAHHCTRLFGVLHDAHLLVKATFHRAWAVCLTTPAIIISMLAAFPRLSQLGSLLLLRAASAAPAPATSR